MISPRSAETEEELAQFRGGTHARGGGQQRGWREDESALRERGGDRDDPSDCQGGRRGDEEAHVVDKRRQRVDAEMPEMLGRDES